MITAETIDLIIDFAKNINVKEDIFLISLINKEDKKIWEFLSPDRQHVLEAQLSSEIPSVGDLLEMDSVFHYIESEDYLKKLSIISPHWSYKLHTIREWENSKGMKLTDWLGR
jgi:hypothetical protein